MSATSALANEIADALIARLKDDPSTARALRDALGVDEAPADDGPKWQKLDQYAKRTGFSRRTIERFIARGLPCEGKNAGRRVDVERADAWLRVNLGKAEGADEAEAAARGALDAAKGSKGKRRHLHAVGE